MYARASARRIYRACPWRHTPRDKDSIIETPTKQTSLIADCRQVFDNWPTGHDAVGCPTPNQSLLDFFSNKRLKSLLKVLQAADLYFDAVWLAFLLGNWVWAIVSVTGNTVSTVLHFFRYKNKLNCWTNYWIKASSLESKIKEQYKNKTNNCSAQFCR